MFKLAIYACNVNSSMYYRSIMSLVMALSIPFVLLFSVGHPARQDGLFHLTCDKTPHVEFF